MIDVTRRDEKLSQNAGSTGNLAAPPADFALQPTLRFKICGRYQLGCGRGPPHPLIYRALVRLERAPSRSLAQLRAGRLRMILDFRIVAVDGFHDTTRAYTAADAQYTGKVTVPVRGQETCGLSTTSRREPCVC